MARFAIVSKVLEGQPKGWTQAQLAAQRRDRLPRWRRARSVRRAATGWQNRLYFTVWAGDDMRRD